MLMPVEVLLVEDNQADVDLLEEVLLDSRLHVRVDHAGDGELALLNLEARLERGAALPDLVLLDLNLPRRDGREFLALIRSHPSLRHLPVVVLSSSRFHADISTCERLGVKDYLTKPQDGAGIRRALSAIESLWFVAVRDVPEKA